MSEDLFKSTMVFARDTTFDGRYTIIRELGRGGMGLVYEAETTDHRRVAIKRMQSERSSEMLVARFLREADVLSKITHPNIVRVNRTGSFCQNETVADEPSKAETVHYIEMELVEGATLEGLTQSGEPLSLRRIVEIMAKLSGGVAHCHSEGIVHRDIKPANVIVSQGIPKLIDFGLAGTVQVADETLVTPNLTVTGMIFGTPRYMSPEQAKGAKMEEGIETPTDVYSLGATLFYLLTGKHPYPTVGDGDLITDLRCGTTTLDPRVFRQDLADIVGGEKLAEITLAATARSPSTRPTAAELQSQLEQLLKSSRSLVAQTMKGLVRKNKRAIQLCCSTLLALMIFWLLSQADWSKLQRDPKDIFVERVEAMESPELRRKTVFDKLQELNPALSLETLTVTSGESDQLKIVFSDSSGIEFIWPLRALRELKELDLSTKQSVGQPLDLTQLKGLQLSTLIVNGRKVQLSDLPPMPLRKLCINSTGTVSIASLSGMQLEVLECSGNAELSDIAPLRGMPLRELVCSNTGIVDLDCLSSMSETLEYLNIEYIPGTDLRPILGCKKLKSLYCDRWPGEDFFKLQDLEVYARLRSRKQ